jgi:hypothetical protein
VLQDVHECDEIEPLVKAAALEEGLIDLQTPPLDGIISVWFVRFYSLYSPTEIVPHLSKEDPFATAYFQHALDGSWTILSQPLYSLSGLMLFQGKMVIRDATRVTIGAGVQ